MGNVVSKNLLTVALMVALGGLLSGYDTGVISGALLYIRDDWQLSDLMSGYLVSCVLVGAAIGAITNGVLADVFGRRKIILFTAVIFFIGSIACALAPNIYILMLSRFIVGYAIGIVTFVVPLYLSEVSPEKNRGSLVSLFQLAITAGILFSYLVNASFANVPYDWRWMLLVGIIPALILGIGMWKMPDTPRWLILKGRCEEAQRVFEKIQPDKDAVQEVELIKNSLRKESKSEDKKFEFKKWMWAPLIVGVGAMFVQQWTGINTIIYYAPTILKLAGFSTNAHAVFATVVIGIVNFLMTFVAIAFCDKFGRKPLLYAGLFGMGTALILLGGAFQFSEILGESLKWIALTSAVVYIMCFSFSLGPIILLIVSEVFPLSMRGVGMSIAAMSNFVFNFTVTLSFLPMLKHFGESHSFWLFAAICFLSMVFCYFKIPETKGVTLEQIEKNWLNGRRAREFQED